jgi:transposase
MAKELEKEKRALNERIKRLEQEVEKRVQRKWIDEYQRLISIADIGKVIATALLVMTYGFSRFTDVKAFFSYIGLAPAPYYPLGTSIKGKGHLSKIGSPVIRRLQYLGSWTAKHQNLPCKVLYQRLKNRGKPEKVIKIAIAHKLLRSIKLNLFCSCHTSVASLYSLPNWRDCESIHPQACYNTLTNKTP